MPNHKLLYRQLKWILFFSFWIPLDAKFVPMNKTNSRDRSSCFEFYEKDPSLTCSTVFDAMPSDGMLMFLFQKKCETNVTFIIEDTIKFTVAQDEFKSSLTRVSFTDEDTDVKINDEVKQNRLSNRVVFDRFNTVRMRITTEGDFCQVKMLEGYFVVDVAEVKPPHEQMDSEILALIASGGAIGGCLVIAGVVLFVYCIFCKKPEKEKKKEDGKTRTRSKERHKSPKTKDDEMPSSSIKSTIRIEKKFVNSKMVPIKHKGKTKPKPKKDKPKPKKEVEVPTVDCKIQRKEGSKSKVDKTGADSNVVCKSGEFVTPKFFSDQVSEFESRVELLLEPDIKVDFKPIGRLNHYFAITGFSNPMTIDRLPDVIQLIAHFHKYFKTKRYYRSDTSYTVLTEEEEVEKLGINRMKYFKFGPPRVTDQAVADFIAVDALYDYLYNIYVIDSCESVLMKRFFDCETERALTEKEFEFYASDYASMVYTWKAAKIEALARVKMHLNVKEDQMELFDHVSSPDVSWLQNLFWFYELHGEYINKFPLQVYLLGRMPLQALILLLLRPDISYEWEERILMFIKLTQFSLIRRFYQKKHPYAKAFPMVAWITIWYRFNITTVDDNTFERVKKLLFKSTVSQEYDWTWDTLLAVPIA